MARPRSATGHGRTAASVATAAASRGSGAGIHCYHPPCDQHCSCVTQRFSEGFTIAQLSPNFRRRDEESFTGQVALVLRLSEQISIGARRGGSIDTHDHAPEYRISASRTDEPEGAASVEILLHLAHELAVCLSSNAQAASARPMLRQALQLVDAIFETDRHLSELFCFAAAHHDDIRTVPATLQRSLPLYAPEGGKFYLAQATKDNASELSNLPANESRFGAWLLSPTISSRPAVLFWKAVASMPAEQRKRLFPVHETMHFLLAPQSVAPAQFAIWPSYVRFTP